jgi:hypothetical protein
MSQEVRYVPLMAQIIDRCGEEKRPLCLVERDTPAQGAPFCIRFINKLQKIALC